MGKTGRWLRSFLTGKKREKDEEKERCMSQPLPLPSAARPSAHASAPPKEKRRWSFRRPAAAKDMNSTDRPLAPAQILAFSAADVIQKRHAMTVSAATAAATDAAVAAAVIRLSGTAAVKRSAVEEAEAAVKIQAAFRGYLARKALCALKGLVRLQALVRGHLVRRQATATLRSMQALLTAQARARAQRMRMLEEAQSTPQRQPSSFRRSPQRYRHPQEIDRSAEENIKIVEVDHAETRGSSKGRSSYSSPTPTRRTDPPRFSTHGHSRRLSKLDPYQQLSPTPSALTDASPRAYSSRFDDYYCFTTAESSPQFLSSFSMSEVAAAAKPPPAASRHEDTCPAASYGCSFPHYMANTESSRAKARSQSAPKLRPDSSERPPSRRRASLEGRSIPRGGARMQRSSSQAGSAANGFHYPWSVVKLDRSSMSLQESECGSTSTILTNTNYCRSLVA